MATEQNYQATTNGTNADTLEKDFSPNHLHNGMDENSALERIRTAGSISISPELFEKIYLSPQNQVKGELRRTFGNPTPLALIGFLMSLTPASCDLMGWRGAGGITHSVASGTATYFFFGGLLMILGALGEWIIGNTFPFVVFGSFGAFWLGVAATLQPFYNAYGAFSTTTNAADGLFTPGFNAGFAFFFLWMGVLCFIYLICALRTNVVFVLIFFTLVFAFSFLAAAYWYIALGKLAYALKMAKAGGAFAFVTCVCGWWIFFAIMLAALDFPFQIPVGDLSRWIPSASEKMKAKEKV